MLLDTGHVKYKACMKGGVYSQIDNLVASETFISVQQNTALYTLKCTSVSHQPPFDQFHTATSRDLNTHKGFFVRILKC